MQSQGIKQSTYQRNSLDRNQDVRKSNPCKIKRQSNIKMPRRIIDLQKYGRELQKKKDLESYFDDNAFIVSQSMSHDQILMDRLVRSHRRNESCIPINEFFKLQKELEKKQAIDVSDIEEYRPKLSKPLNNNVTSGNNDENVLKKSTEKPVNIRQEVDADLVKKNIEDKLQTIPKEHLVVDQSTPLDKESDSVRPIQKKKENEISFSECVANAPELQCVHKESKSIRDLSQSEFFTLRRGQKIKEGFVQSIIQYDFGYHHICREVALGNYLLGLIPHVTAKSEYTIPRTEYEKYQKEYDISLS